MAGHAREHITHEQIYRHKPDEDPPPQTEHEHEANQKAIAEWWSMPGIIPGCR